MRRCIGRAILTGIAVICGISFTNVSASSQSVVISQIQLGDSLSASNEFVEIYNNSDVDIDITDWCLYYASATSTQIGSKMGCFLTDGATHVFLPARSFAFAISTQLAVNSPNVGSDIRFSATLSGTSGHVRIIDATDTVVDTVGWGTAVSPETTASSTASNGMILERKSIDASSLQDTDNNFDDFRLNTPRLSYEYGNVYEVQDQCVNIEGFQEIIPENYTVDMVGICTPPPVDVCVNIGGIQVDVPNGYAIDDTGLCQVDACENIDGPQITLPVGYIYNASDECVLIPKKLVITELLPNPDGDDSGNEFIELYNPNIETVSLDGYAFYVGTNTTTVYGFPNGTYIEPHAYMVFYNDTIHFTLVNTTGGIHLLSTDDILVDSSDTYVSATSGMSWSLIHDTWQYTNQPTPGYENLPSLVDTIEEVVTGLKPCALNQYRNPQTNRCRLIVTVSSTLKPCKDGQYRSEITNRCRSIAADVSSLTPCDANQYRNPTTNRCKLITSSSSSLTPCGEGQERNPETNRCRNVVGNVPTAGFAVEPIPDTAGTASGWWAVAGVCLLAVGYGVWEWRQELRHAIRRVSTFFHSAK
jgi:hypothetical protein